MKILIVIDQFDDANNGTTISAKRFAKGLEDRGHEVFVVSTGKEGPKKYRVEELKLLPIASHIVHSQGMSFALPSKEVLEKAISNADVVHLRDIIKEKMEDVLKNEVETRKEEDILMEILEEGEEKDEGRVY